MVCGWGVNIGDLGNLEPLSYRTHRTRLERLPIRFFRLSLTPFKRLPRDHVRGGKKCRLPLRFRPISESFPDGFQVASADSLKVLDDLLTLDGSRSFLNRQATDKKEFQEKVWK